MDGILVIVFLATALYSLEANWRFNFFYFLMIIHLSDTQSDIQGHLAFSLLSGSKAIYKDQLY